MNKIKIMNNYENSGIDNPNFIKDTNDLDVEKINNCESDNKKIKERPQWNNSVEFLMSCIAMSVGLGNIWRFPFTAYENGGGAFLIPYIIVLLLVGRPLYYLEMALGQFSNRGNVKIYEALSPILKGVAYGQVIGTICVATYYCCLMAITLFYLINSFNYKLPWTECLNRWDSYLENNNKTCIPANYKGVINTTINGISSSELYFTQEVLKESVDISNGIGFPEWRLSICLLVGWAFTFLVSMKGVKSSGKASYFLAIFPYIVMVSLLIRALTLEGAKDGIYYFIKTDWNKLIEPNVWYAAISQCFFSLNVGFGSIIMYSSYNNFNHNINRDIFIVTTLDTFTSLLSGVTIFGILGNLANNLGVTPDKVISTGGGTGLAFISYPDAIAKMEFAPWFFSIIFFLMLFILGIGSLVALQSTVNTVVADIFPCLSTWKISLITALGGFFIGLMYVTPGGQFMLTLMDFFGGTFIIYFFVIIETAGVAWFYGIKNFILDIEFMLNIKLGIYWRITLGLLTPIILFIVFFYFIIKSNRLTYGKYSYPNSVLAFGWLILGISVAQFLLWIAFYIYTNRDYGFPKVIIKTIATTDKWGPKDQIKFNEWKQFKEISVYKGNTSRKGFLRKYLNFFMGK